MEIKCPHCGTEYEIGKSEYGRYVKCEICGKGFVAGTFAAKKPDRTANSANDNVANALDTVFEQTKKIDWQAHKERVKTASSTASKKVGEYFRERTEKNFAKNPKMAQFIRMLSSSPWTVQFSTVYLLMFGLTFAFCILLTSQLFSSFIPALMTLVIALTISFTLVRSNFVRWMLILWGVFNLIILVFGSSDFRWLWPFNAGFATLAILLILKMTNQWYKNGPALNVSADIMAYQQVAVFAAILAVIANVVIYVGYSSVRKQMRLSRSRALSYDAPASSSHSSKYASPSQTSADEAISGALANVKSRYRAMLDHYGLTESYFDETSGICDLMLLDVQSWTKYQIVYYRATDEISWPRMMPKGVAKDLMQDRLLIQKYELVLGKGKKKAKDDVDSSENPRTPQRSVRHKKPKPPPLHKEPELTPEEKADIEDALKNAREANEAYEKNRKKPSLAQTSDFRQMDELKRRGMSGDEIASRFGIDRVREYNAAHPKSTIKTSKHSKPGAPGFVW